MLGSPSRAAVSEAAGVSLPISGGAPEATRSGPVLRAGSVGWTVLALVAAQGAQVVGEGVGRGEGVGVVGTQDPAPGLEGGPVQVVGFVVAAQGAQVDGEVVGLVCRELFGQLV